MLECGGGVGRCGKCRKRYGEPQHTSFHTFPLLPSPAPKPQHNYPIPTRSTLTPYTLPHFSTLTSHTLPHLPHTSSYLSPRQHTFLHPSQTFPHFPHLPYTPTYFPTPPSTLLHLLPTTELIKKYARDKTRNTRESRWRRRSMV